LRTGRSLKYISNNNWKEKASRTKTPRCQRKIKIQETKKPNNNQGINHKKAPSPSAEFCQEGLVLFLNFFIGIYLELFI
jgi:hypothetical protein